MYKNGTSKNCECSPNDKNLPKFTTKEWIEDQSERNYSPHKKIIIKTSMPISDLCDYSDAYIIVKWNIILTKTNERRIIDIRNRFLAFKNNAPFTNCISKINNVLIDNLRRSRYCNANGQFAWIQ